MSASLIRRMERAALRAGYTSPRGLPHALMVKRGLRRFYRGQAISRGASGVSWVIVLVGFVHVDIPAVWYLLAGACAAAGAFAAWSHHHDGALGWMSERVVLNVVADYLRRTAHDRRVSMDVPGIIEATALLSMITLTAMSAPPPGGDVLAWSIAVALLLNYLPFVHFVIDPSWYQPRLTGRIGYVGYRYGLPLAFAAGSIALFWLAAPQDATGPDTGILLVAWILRLYMVMRLEDSIVDALDDSLRDQHKDLSDAVSSEVHSRVKNELRILAAQIDLDAQTPAVQASWHSLSHNVERLRRHPFDEKPGQRSIAAVVGAVRATVNALAEDPASVDFSVDTTTMETIPLRQTDMALLELTLGDLCANSIREANRLRRDRFEINVVIKVDEGPHSAITMTVDDSGTGFPTGQRPTELRTSLNVLDRRLRRRGGGLELGTSDMGGARVIATWRSL